MYNLIGYGCPCGYYTDPHKICRCNPNKISGYLGKISGPLLDRIDIHIELPPVKYKELVDAKDAESSMSIKARVENARAIQTRRLSYAGIFFNAQMNHKLVRRFCSLGKDENELLKLAMTELSFSARAFDKILKIARTIADLAGSEGILTHHISEAVQYRSLDKNL